MQKWAKQFWFIALVPLVDVAGRLCYAYIMNGNNLSPITTTEDRATRMYCICSLFLPMLLFEFIKRIVEPKARLSCLFWQIIVAFKIAEELYMTPTELNALNVLIVVPGFILCRYEWVKNFKNGDPKGN